MERQAVQLQRGLLVEVDQTVFPGMELFYGACRERLGREGLKLDRAAFTRYLYGRPLVAGMAALLEKAAKDAAAPVLAGDCTAAYIEALVKAGGKARDGVLGLVKEAAARKVKVGLVTQMSEADAQQVFAEVLGEMVVAVTEPPSCACRLGWENWRRVARKLQLKERLCVAVCSPGSARGALAASMRVVVIQDEMQAHMDCSGVDLMVEAITPSVRAAAFGLLRLPPV